MRSRIVLVELTRQMKGSQSNQVRQPRLCKHKRWCHAYYDPGFTEHSKLGKYNEIIRFVTTLM